MPPPPSAPPPPSFTALSLFGATSEAQCDRTNCPINTAPLSAQMHQNPYQLGGVNFTKKIYALVPDAVCLPCPTGQFASRKNASGHGVPVIDLKNDQLRNPDPGEAYYRLPMPYTECQNW